MRTSDCLTFMRPIAQDPRVFKNENIFSYILTHLEFGGFIVLNRHNQSIGNKFYWIVRWTQKLRFNERIKILRYIIKSNNFRKC